MGTTAYLSVSFSKRKQAERALNAIVATLNGFNIAAFIFVDNYKFDAAAEKEMMRQAMADIDQSDFLIAETSEKGIGIGIEAGYAKAKGKPVVYVRQKDAEHSTTLSGISDFQVVYKDSEDLQKKLDPVIRRILGV